jgi:uncharacterized membrane protein
MTSPSDSTWDGLGSSADDGETPQTLVGVSFDDAFRASEFLLAVRRLHHEGHLRLVDAVLVSKAEDGKTHVQETTDTTPGTAALSGALWTGLIGFLLGGPVGWLVGGAVGAGVGATTAHFVDLGVPDEWVEWFRAAVQPGTTTVVLLLTHLRPGPFTQEAERFHGAHLLYANLDPGRVARLREAFGDTAGQDADYPGSVEPGA